MTELTAPPKSRQRIVHVITTLDVGGAQATMAEIVCRLDPSEFEPIVISGTDEAPDVIAHRLSAAGIPLLQTSTLRRSVNIADPRAILALRRAVDTLRPDVVHTHSSKAGFLGRAAVDRRLSTAVVHTVHGWSFNERQPALVREAIIRLERRLARRTDAFVVVTGRDREIGLEHKIGTQADYRTIRSGVDFRSVSDATRHRDVIRRSLGFQPEQHVVAWVGRFAPQKDPRVLAQVVRHTIEREPAVAFVLIGSGPMEQETRRLLPADVGERVQVLGLRDDVFELLAASDALLLTSAWEGLPRVVVEALALGRPVIATDVGGIREVVRHGETGWLVPVGDVTGLAVGLRRARQHLLNGPGPEGQMAILEEFSALRMTKHTSDLYRSLTATGPRPTDGLAPVTAT